MKRCQSRIQQLLHGKLVWKTKGITPRGAHLDVWQSQIPPCFSNVRRISSLLPYWAVDCRGETRAWAIKNIIHDPSISGQRLLLTEKASFSKKCAIPLGYFASCRDPELTKTSRKTKTFLILADGRSWKHFTHCNLLPTVQNWPNLFWEATLRPFSRVVILVSYFSWPSTEANTGLGIPGSGLEREIFGYPPPLLYFL